MKKFATYLLTVAAGCVALLSSCIKEEAYVVDTAELSVNLTRAGTSSTAQGDAITDAWIWAFPCTLNNNGEPQINDDAVATGSRYVSGLNNYGNISVHVPLPICDGAQDYLLVAIINTKSFTGTNLSSQSTWGDIKNASFDQNGEFWAAYPNDSNKTPEVMPVSNWTTLRVTSANTHPNNCYHLNLPVYRAVAKAQFFASKSDQNLNVEILDVKVVAKRGYSDGMVIVRNTEQVIGSNAETIERGLPSAEAANWWWNTPTTATGLEYQMKNSDSGYTAVNIGTVTSTSDLQNGKYTWVASTFLYENDNDAPTPNNYDYTTQQGDGYNICVTYRVDGQEKVAYTPLGKVARNHDYQIKATIESGGSLTLDIIVNEWLLDQEQTMDYQNTVTVSNEDVLKWRSATPSTEGGKTTVHTDGTVTTLPVGDYTTTRHDIVDLGSLANGKASLDFALRAPIGGRWYAELVTIQGEVGAVVFADNNSTVISGDINTVNRITLNIKNAKANSATQGGVTDNIVELQITAKKTWGGQERTYKVYGLTGLDDNANYKLIQPLGN